MTVKRLVLGEVATNCYIVSEGKTSIIIDPADDAETILENCGKAPSAVLLTHGHFDHISALDGLKRAYPDLPVYIGNEDLVMLSDPEKNGSLDLMGEGISLESGATAIESEDEFVIGDLKVKPFFTPGHSKGSVTYEIKGSLFAGDLLFAHSGYGRVDLYGGNLREIYKSIMRILEMPPDTVVYPGHGTPFTLEEYR